jgi:hypothetical protein
MRSIAGFLELPFERAMVEYGDGRTRHKPGLSSKGQWLPPTAGLRDWRVSFSPRDLQLFEVLAGDVLASSGYELAADLPIPPEVTATAERCRRWWETEFGQQPRA